MKKALKLAGGRYENPWPNGGRRSFFQLMKWLVFSKNRFAEEKKRAASFEVRPVDFKSLDKTPGDYIVWLGHSTVLVRASSKVIITDPVFWDVNFFIKRKTPAPADPADLPQVDYVLISHAHLDHLNTKSVRYLKKRFDPVFVTGPGYERYFRRRVGRVRHKVLDWWEAHADGRLKITALPVQHWSKRALFDTNRTLWCSYMVESGAARYYWIGDTGYFKGFREVGRVFGPVDVLMAPIGAYEPQWFMAGNHLNPAEALRVAEDVRARVMLPIHWGTFDLSDEPLWLPVKELEKAAMEANTPEVMILPHGGSYRPGLS